jgi:hypothetical protein
MPEMALLPKSKLWRIMIVVGVIALLIAFFYAEEDWRGKCAWENYKRELEAKGEILDWNKLVPPPVPDDQNFFKAPKMADWFIRPDDWRHPSLTNELTERLRNADTTATNLTEIAATKYLAWSDQFEPQYDLIREALKRPYARMDGNYSDPLEIPIPNFVAVRSLAQVLAQRAKCYLLIGRPERALNELALLNDSRRLLENAPTGKPMPLVSAMINVAVVGLYVNTIAGGFKSHSWQEPQLALLQGQLSELNLIPLVSQALHEESAHDCRFIEQLETASKIDKKRMGTFLGIRNLWRWKNLDDSEFLLFNVAPSGWISQNLIIAVKAHEKVLDEMDASNTVVFPQKIDATMRETENIINNDSLYGVLASISIPNYSKAFQTLAYNQTLANEAQIACALERYHLAHGEYPETLDALAPQFIETIPHDIIGGQPLHYRRTDDGKFLLYSVGWNETDDGGLDLSQKNKFDFTQGDWVWKN